MLPIRNISYLLPMCCSFWEKCKNSPKTSLGCSTPLKLLTSVSVHGGSYMAKLRNFEVKWCNFVKEWFNLRELDLKLIHPLSYILNSKSTTEGIEISTGRSNQSKIKLSFWRLIVNALVHSKMAVAYTRQDSYYDLPRMAHFQSYSYGCCKLK